MDSTTRKIEKEAERLNTAAAETMQAVQERVAAENELSRAQTAAATAKIAVAGSSLGQSEPPATVPATPTPTATPPVAAPRPMTAAEQQARNILAQRAYADAAMAGQPLPPLPR